MKTISLRLAWYFGLTIFLACVGIGVFVFSYSTHVLEEAVESTVPVYAEGTAALIGNSLNAQLNTLETVAQRDVIRGLNWPEQKSALTKEADGHGNLHLGFAGRDGQLMRASDTSIDISDNS